MPYLVPRRRVWPAQTAAQQAVNLRAAHAHRLTFFANFHGGFDATRGYPITNSSGTMAFNRVMYGRRGLYQAAAGVAQINVSSNTIFDADNCSIVLGACRTSIGGWGLGYDSGGSSRILLMLDYVAGGTGYFDYGNGTAAQGRVSFTMPTQTIGKYHVWVFVAGKTRGREVWFDGKRIASDVTATLSKPSNTSNFAFNAAGGAGSPENLIDLFAVFSRELAPSEIVDYSVNPAHILRAYGRFPYPAFSVYPYTAAGGATLGGAATWNRGKAAVVSGGATLGGAATWNWNKSYAPSGGITAGGAATAFTAYTRYYTGAGGARLGGSAITYGTDLNTIGYGETTITPDHGDSEVTLVGG